MATHARVPSCVLGRTNPVGEAKGLVNSPMVSTWARIQVCHGHVRDMGHEHRPVSSRVKTLVGLKLELNSHGPSLGLGKGCYICNTAKSHIRVLGHVPFREVY
ncbi:Bifunctional FolD [Gossypium arboreum]|uniref:Bifunctional FolD n=1 Tax=Gossypium arboreum TaxID=29729 RepID=A0A0B0MS81_GOSAR|nr:Bifunctional FolD [Gossypium arboreum]